jgi:formylglycine-generating enzyme required for sulfatase activity
MRCAIALFAVLSSLAIIVAGTARAATPRKPKLEGSSRWALLIGVEDYIRLEKLHYCSADMRALREQLLECGFPQRQITLLEDKAETKLRPYKSAIDDQLDQSLKLVEADDVLLVAFSGHGVSIGGKSYLCPLDAKLSDTDSMISVDALYERLAKCPAAMKIVLIDACRDDPRLGGDKTAASAPDQRELAAKLQRPPEGIYCLTSCSPGERSKEDPKLGHGVFMHFVLEGLRGAADTRKRGKVSLEDLCRYARDETKFYVRDKYNEIQRPWYKIESSDEFDIATGLSRNIVNSLGMKLALIPAGRFQMGSGESKEVDGADNPRHEVRITRDFYLGTYHVTVGEFRKFVNAANYKTDAERDGKGGYGIIPTGAEQNPKFTWRNPNFAQSDDCPVVNVSWNDATAFCKWLSGKEGKEYRLPTEAEWEYACRAGSTTRFSFGDDERLLGGYAWHSENSADKTHPVGQKKPNAFGLYDMHGNARQWCADWYGEKYYAASPVDDPGGPDFGTGRVLRGGAFSTSAEYSSATRMSGAVDDRNYATGFRVARTK